MLPEIAIGAIVAAIIGAMISLAGLVVSKESKVSEFRQGWIDSLRDELSTFASALNAICDSREVEFKSNKERFDTLQGQTTKLNESFFSVALRLNVTEETSSKLKTSMVSLMQLAQRSEGFNRAIFEAEQVTFIQVSNTLLKDEWKRVKAGEKVYRATRLISALTIGALTIIVAVLLGANLIAGKEDALPKPTTVIVEERSAKADERCRSLHPAPIPTRQVVGGTVGKAAPQSSEKASVHSAPTAKVD